MKPDSVVARALLPVLAAYVRHAPDHPGHWRLANLAVEWVPQLKSSSRRRIIRVREGFRLLVNGQSQTGRIAYATGSYEPRATALIRSLVKPGDTVVDVGANIGYFSLVASQAAGPDGRVLAFEPVPAVRAVLFENLKLNAVTNVTVREDALSDREGQIQFYLGPEGDSGLGSLRALDRGQQIVVHQTRFDDLECGRIALVKMDVEGGELRALRGMSRRLVTDRPALVLEVTDAYLRGLGDSAADLLGFLHEHGYRVFELRDEGPPREIPDAATLSRCPTQFNAYGVHRSDERQPRIP